MAARARSNKTVPSKARVKQARREMGNLGKVEPFPPGVPKRKPRKFSEK